jgi:lipase ATG15
MLLPTALTILTTSLPFVLPKAATSPLHFELRHLHAVSSSAQVIFFDVSPAQIHSNQLIETSYTVNTRSASTYRPPAFHLYSRARRRSLTHSQTEDLLGEEIKIPVPDVEARESLLHLAKMSNNAYVLPDDDAWYDLGDDWDPVSRYVVVLGEVSSIL